MSRQQANCVVNSHNEWDPLEEVIVGRLEDATMLSYHVTIAQSLPSIAGRLFYFFAGRRFPKWVVKAAQKELDEFIHLLEGEGVKVRRPDVLDFHAVSRTPHWSSSGYCVACPRDIFLVIGSEIIETPCCWRSRFFEPFAYRTLFKEYFIKGAKWTAAPRPELRDELYDRDFKPVKKGEQLRYMINGFEPVFDAADFVRCGKDLFVIRSNVTNALGIEWLRRHLGDAYRIHEVESICRRPMHIDSSLLPLAPGKLLVNSDYIDVNRLPSILKSWDILIAPKPDPLTGFIARAASAVSEWTSINVLMLDEKRVVADSSQVSLIKKLKDWGFTPITRSFNNYRPFGGSFHCATLDIRRRGTLQSYF